jgi:uncharacterized protein YecE (DUF72 family)
VLAQFPPSFKSTPASHDYLSQLLQVLGDYRVAVELRHSSWSDAFGETSALLNTFNAAWVQIDEPKFRFSIARIPAEHHRLLLHAPARAQRGPVVAAREERGPLQLPLLG